MAKREILKLGGEMRFVGLMPVRPRLERRGPGDVVAVSYAPGAEPGPPWRGEEADVRALAERCKAMDVPDRRARFREFALGMGGIVGMGPGEKVAVIERAVVWFGLEGHGGREPDGEGGWKLWSRKKDRAVRVRRDGGVEWG